MESRCALHFPYSRNFTEQRLRANFIELERWVDMILSDNGCCCDGTVEEEEPTPP